MVILVQARQRLLLKQEVTGKISHFQRRRSVTPTGPLQKDFADIYLGCLAKKEKRHTTKPENVYSAKMTRQEMPHQVNWNTCLATPRVLTNNVDTEDGNEMSRSSSVSTKDRASQNKRPKPAKQRRDDSESFDVRSQYAPFFPPQQTPTWIPTPQYTPAPQYNSSAVPINYPNQMPGHFLPGGTQQFPGMMNNGGMPQYTTAPQVS